MSLKETINNDLKKATLNREKLQMIALKEIKSLILLEETKGTDKELSQEDEIKLLTKALKQRKESYEMYSQNGRQEQAQEQKIIIETIEKYLPEEMSDEEVKAYLENLIKKLGAASPKDMGKVMGVASKELAGKADGKKIAETVKKLLNT